MTLKKTDSQFKTMLNGHSEHLTRPIPIKSYNVGLDDEAITFELRPISEIKTPHFFKFVGALVKYKTWVVVLWPLVFVLTQAYPQDNFDSLSAGLAAVASFLLLSGLNIRNDVYDHLTGYDRVNIDVSHKPISLGWLTATQALKISNICILLSALSAVPIFWWRPQVLVIVVVAAILFLSSHFFEKNSYKSQHFGEISLLLLCGPLYFCGLLLAINVEIQTRLLYYSGLWGLAVLFLIHVNNFSHLMTSSQNKIKNTMTKLGFDRAQKFLIAHWALVVFIWCWFYFAWNWLTFLSIAIFVSAAIYFNFKILRIASPMGSGLMRIRRLAYSVFTLMVLLSALLTLSAFQEILS